MTTPKISFDWTVTLGSMVSTAVWLAGAVWVASTLVAAVEQTRRDVAQHSKRLDTLEREGSDIAKQDHQRLNALERRVEINDVTLAQMRDMLARIDENVKALKEAQRPAR